jgi:4-amino-4-deoxy-L-arabinose transferase-like glycosyltransferase
MSSRADDPTYPPFETPRGGPPILAEFGSLAILGLAWLGMAILVNPRGDFSLNDDWAYGLPVRALVEKGEFRFTFWQSMTLITQVFWGALFCLPVGFSFDALRISTLVAGLVGTLGLYGLLRHFGAARLVALLGALFYAIDPLYFGLSCTFMTDVPFTSLMILSILGLARGLDQDRSRDIWLGLTAALVALFIRQLALAVFLGFLVASPIRYGFGRRWLVRGMLPLLIAGGSLAAFNAFMKTSGRLPGVYYSKPETLKMVFQHMIHLKLGAVKPALAASLIMMMFAGLMATPWLALLAPSLVGKGSPRARKIRIGWIVGFSVVVTVILGSVGKLMPMTGNIMDDFKMGLLSLPGVPPAGPSKVFWVAVTALASAGVAGLLLIVFDLVVVIFSRERDPETNHRRCHAVFLITTGVTYFGPIGLPYQLMLDRYVLPVLPLFMVMALLDPGVERRRPPALALVASLLLALGFASYTIATTHDYFVWQRAAWATFADLTETKKIAPEDIDGGFEFNNQIPNWRDISTTSVNSQLVENADKRQYSVSYSELPGRRVIERRRCKVWLPYSPHEIFVLRRID